MLARLPLDSALEMVAASGFVARDPVPLPPHAGARALLVLPGVQGAEVPHDQSLHQQHRERRDQRGPGPAGQPARTRAADHLHSRLRGAGGAAEALRSSTADEWK